MSFSDFESHYAKMLDIEPCKGRTVWAIHFAATLRNALWCKGLREPALALALKFDRIADEWLTT